MPVQRLLPFLFSVLFAVGIWFYGAMGQQTNVVTRNGYATLVCGEFYTDREIRDRLDGLGLAGLVSESDQWALLDCFGSVEKIPLVEYSQRLLPFDPRNDGYAEKLRNVFISDGKRFVYIPLEKNRLENLEMKIAQALAGIPYSLEYARPLPRRDILLPLIAFCLTAGAFFVIPALRRRLNSSFLPCLITLSPLAFGLAPGFALVSLLLGFAALLAEPGRKAPFSSGRQSAYDLPRPFTPRWLLAAALIACYGFFSFFSGLPVLLTFLVLAAFCCALAVSIRAGGGKLSIKFTVKKIHTRGRRFTPVEIISRKTQSYSFFPVMLPFAAMALALAFAGFARPQQPSSPVANILPPPAGMISEADFQEHYLFQSSFSLRALGKSYEDGLPPVIAAYELSSNGLLEPVASGIEEELQIPDFPLGDLLKGLNSAPPQRVVDDGSRGNSLDWLFVSLPMFFILPDLIYGRKKRQRKGLGAGVWG